MAYRDRLPQYLHNNPVWLALADASETVLDQGVFTPVQQLLSVRDVNNFHPSALAAKKGTQLLDANDASFNGVTWNSKTTRVALATMLGMNFFNLSTISDNSIYDNFIKYSVQFFPEQGTNSWPNFLGFSTDTLIQITQLWAQLDATGTQYVNMTPAGNASIGTPVWNGGTWFPTSHYDVTVLSNFGTTNLTQLTELLQFVAPINIVFRNVVSEYASNVTNLEYAMSAVVYVTWL